MINKISEVDLIINPDGSIYHLNLLPEDIADTIITVGDPERVSEVSKHFDHIELKKGKREFISHTGYLGSRRITVISTGIGTDNIDIVINELDALLNIDFNTRTLKPILKSLNIIRIGTSGAVQEDIPVGSILVSEYGIGLDAMMQYYSNPISNDEQMILDTLKLHFNHLTSISPYIASSDPLLLQTIGKGLFRGISLTAPGFYAPQGRQLRAEASFPDLIHDIRSFANGKHRITNLEMETAGIYALSKVLGHKAVSVNAILASRIKLTFEANPEKIISKAIRHVLDRL